MRHSFWKYRGNLILVMGLIGTLFAISNVSQAQVAVTGDLAVDNFAQVFTGDLAGTSVTNIGGGVTGPNITTTYSFNTTDDYLYIAAWSDDGVQQGLLHDFAFDGNPFWSGNPAWQVYATGLDLDVSASILPTQLGIQIGIANAAAGGAGTSVTWVVPAVGGINNGTFPTANPWAVQALIATTANWTWYDSGLDTTAVQPPFRGGFDHFEYLIFRTPIIPEPSTAVLALLGMSALGLLTRSQKRLPPTA